ncbi:MAG: endonuclease/exonuclease/phosphatase family protein [Alphaproteobacteria bacterium]
MKFVSYNIQYSKGRDGRFDLERIAKAIDDADVIALQEVERHWPRSGMVDQPAEIGALLPDYYWVYGPSFDMDASRLNDDGSVDNRRRQFGNMLLARRPIVSSRLLPLPRLGTVTVPVMQMGAVEGVIAAESGPIRVVSLHISARSTRERLMQIGYLLDDHARVPAMAGTWSGVRRDDAWTLGEAPPPMPAEAIWMGDFNSCPGSPEYDAIVGPVDPLHGRIDHLDAFVDAWVAAGNAETDGVTYPADGREPDMRLDYCFVSMALASRVRDARIDTEANGSDHQPVWTEIDL